ncbi:MAG: transketolase family protein [Chloroflexi bacterium]|nr:transketolase family protein [Chloroflexota bacterium]MDA1146845.1 transketolase family protein [Chloroflexota bacterium]MQC82457.1 transketolase family protein [Chloroflexota bacterium]
MTTTQAPAPAATREAVGPTLIRLQREGHNLIVVDADLGKSTSARKFRDEFPERFFTFGVAEQNMISAAAGFAAMGHTVFATTFAVFAEHAFDQFRMSVAQPNLNVKLIASHGGVSTGEDGASAQSIEDIAVFASVPNASVCIPADVVESEAIIEAAANTPGPFYVRTARPKTPVIYTDGPRFKLGKADMLRDGRDVTIVACGLLVERALRAADQLATEGIDARVLNMATIRPLDVAALETAARDTGAIVVAEEHLTHTGLGAMCAHALATTTPVPMEFVGVERYGESATWSEALEIMGLTPEGIAAAVRKVVARK